MRLNFLRRLLFAWLALGAAGYFGLVTLYVLPDNPLRVALWPVARAVVGRFFDQRWGMFAPSPLSVSRTLCVRCASGDALSPWVDVTSPLHARVRSQVLASELDVATYFMNMIRREASFRTRTASSGAELETPDPNLARADLDLRWARIGSIVCRDVSPGPFDRVILKYREAPNTPWTAREAEVPPEPESFRDQELGPYPAVPDVAAPGVFVSDEGACRS